MAATQQILMALGASVTPIAFVHANRSYVADGSAGITVSAGSRTTGNTVFAAVVYDNAQSINTAPTFGGQAMVFINERSIASGNYNVQLYSRYLDGTESTNNCFYDLTGAGVAFLGVAEFSGLVNASAEANDVTANTSASMDVVNGLTPTSMNNLIFYVGTFEQQLASGYSSGPDNGFTRLSAIDAGGSSPSMEWGYKIRPADNTSIGSTITLQSSFDWGSVSAAFGGV